MFDSPRKHTCTYNLNIHIIQFICKRNSLEISRSLLFVERGYTMAGTDYKFHHCGFSFYRQYHQVHFIHGRGLSVCSTFSTSERLNGATYFAVSGCRPLSNALSQPCNFTSPSFPFLLQSLLFRTAQYLPHDHDGGGLPRTGVRQKAESKTAID